MSDSNKRKAEFLGMPYGTACGKLRKKILFHFAKRLGDNICYRCGEKIENVEELSIDHKKEWLYTDTELFWDIDNIAFSHLACNTVARRWSGFKPRESPPGMSWCANCKKFLPKKNFGKDKRRVCKTRARCNECRKKSGWDHDNR